MYSILDTIRKSNIKISIPHNSKKGGFFSKIFLSLFIPQLISLYAKNQISTSFWAFHNHLFKLQGIYRVKLKKGHNSVRNQNFKKQKLLF